MKVSYEYDLDPRYGWASVDLVGKERGLIIVHATDGSRGFTYDEGVMVPTCICSSYHKSDCTCPNVDWD